MAVRKPDSVFWKPELALLPPGGGHLSGQVITQLLKRHSPEITPRSTTLHSVRILPFHLRVLIPITELDHQRWDGVSHVVSPMSVSARTSRLAAAGR